MRRFVKQLVWMSVASVVAFIILLISIVRTTQAASDSGKVIGVTKETVKPTTMISVTPDPAPMPIVLDPKESEYYLPYPGILPDHVLYWLKMVRDRIRLWSTWNTVKKAELLLLYADKRINAAKFLIEGNKTSLGVSTASKAETYLGEVLKQVDKAAKSGNNMSEFLRRLDTAVEKHEELLVALKVRIDPGAMPVWEKTIDYVKGVKGEVNKRLGK